MVVSNRPFRHYNSGSAFPRLRPSHVLLSFASGALLCLICIQLFFSGTHEGNSSSPSASISSLSVATPPVRAAASEEAVSLPAWRQRAMRAGKDLPFYIITGASASFYDPLINFIGSVRFWCPDCEIIAYNLGGWDESMVQRINAMCKVTVEWEKGPETGGSHVLMSGNYAFKPLVLKHAVEKYGQAFWIDAGCSITSPIEHIKKYLLDDGYFFVQGQDEDMTKWVCEAMLTHYNKTRDMFVGKPSHAGGIVGFVKDSPVYKAVMDEWLTCAMNPACISPPSCSLSNHRFDQSSLNVILYSLPYTVNQHTETLSAGRQDYGNTPCFTAGTRAIWTARRGESCYAPVASPDCDSPQKFGAKSVGNGDGGPGKAEEGR